MTKGLIPTFRKTNNPSLHLQGPNIKVVTVSHFRGGIFFKLNGLAPSLDNGIASKGCRLSIPDH